MVLPVFLVDILRKAVQRLGKNNFPALNRKPSQLKLVATDEQGEEEVLSIQELTPKEAALLAFYRSIVDDTEEGTFHYGSRLSAFTVELDSQRKPKAITYTEELRPNYGGSVKKMLAKPEVTAVRTVKRGGNEHLQKEVRIDL